MNQTAIIPSPENIKEKLNSVINSSEELIECNQDCYWQNRFKTIVYGDNRPNYLVFPPTKAILSQLVNLAYENYWRILPLGSGTKISWGNLIPRADLMVSTTKLNRIIEYAGDDLTVTVESGVKLADLQQFLAEKAQFLAIDPCYPDSATIGGIVATANTGSWRQGYGGVRDLILGISVIRADGQEVKAGGKVVKNVAGYDLMKLFTGSYGSLGIISEVTFRLYPIPETSATILVTGNPDQIRILQQRIAQSSLMPTAADLVSSALISALNLGSELGLIIRFQSITESVNQQLNQLQNWVKEFNLSGDIYQAEAELNLWQSLQAKVSTPNSDSTIICKLGILPSQIINLFSQFPDYGLVNLSTGIGQLLFSQPVKSTKLKNMREFCQRNSGYLSILQASQQMKRQLEPWGYIDNIVTMMQKLKKNFDPRHVFVNRLWDSNAEFY
jgi:glycolate oxidase FAD binding subunit